MQHPDEGTIHSWLDDALPAEEARALEAHVATCGECAAAVAEARGVRAAATRILSALDDVPAGVIPAPDYFADIRAASDADAARRRASAGGSYWRRPGVRAAAALLVAGGLSWAVVRNVAPAREDSSVVGERGEAVADVAAILPDTTAAPASVGTVVTESVTQGARSAPATRRARAGDGARETVASASPGLGAGRLEARMPEETRRSAVPSRDSVARAEADVARDATTAAAVAQAPALTPAPAAPRRADSMLAARAANKTATGADIARSAAAPPVAQGMAEPRTPRIVIERAYVDSVLAADSMETAHEPATFGTTTAERASRAAAPMAQRRIEESRAAGTPTTTVRAQGCWLLEISEWTPRLRARDTVRFLPRRIELRADRGVLSEEAGQRLVRPAPGEPPLPPGVTAYWRVIATDQVRFTVTDRDRWTTVTATLAADSLHGTARAYTDADRLLRRATVTARRVVCRTEP